MPLPSDKFRWPIIQGRRELNIVVFARMPTDTGRVEVRIPFALAVPKNADVEDEVVIFSSWKIEKIEARLTELIPRNTLPLEMRLRIIIERIITKILQQLEQTSKEELAKLGF